MIEFILEFINGGEGKIIVDELIGFNAAPFVLAQESKRMGRDIQYAGDSEAKFTIYKRQEQEFELMLMYWRKYWINANVRLLISFYGEYQVIGNIDFNNDFETDEQTYIKFTVKQENYISRYKKNFDVPVNFRSDKTLYGEDIEPVQLTKVFVPGKPTKQISTWDNNNQSLDTNFVAYGQDYAVVSLAINQLEYDIKNSVLPFTQYTQDIAGEPLISSNESQIQQIRKENTYIEAKNRLTNVTVDIKGLNLAVTTVGDYVSTQIRLGYGTSYETGQFTSLILFDSETTVNLQNQDYSVNIPAIENTGFLYIFITISQPRLRGTTPVSNSGIQYSLTGGITITATATSYGTVANMMRLEDVLRYATKSASGLEINAPEYQIGQTYGMVYYTTPILMRGLLDKPVNNTCKELVEGIVQPLQNGDYQLNNNGIVLYGNERDFYSETLIYTFDEPYDEFTRKNNPRFAINQANLKFNTFASEKENETEGTFDLVHGEIRTLVKNEAENTKDIVIGAIMDAFLIDDIRQKAYDLTDKTATQDDDKYILLDVVEIDDADRYQRATSNLEHKNSPGGRLILRNDQTFSWKQLGIAVGSQFTIKTELNNGSYTVQNPVTDVQLILFNGQENQDGIQPTTYDYFIESSVTNFIIRTNEGFGLIENINEGDNYANLRFSAGHVLKQRYNSYLATANMFTAQQVQVTEYKNNPEALTVYQGLPVEEGANFNPSQPILNPYLLTYVYIFSLQQYFYLVNLIQNTGGYCQFSNPDGMSYTYGYIQQLQLIPDTKNAANANEDLYRLELTVEEKYMPFSIYLDVTENRLTIGRGAFYTDYTFNIDNYDILTIFDVSRKPILSGFPFQRIAINGVGYDNRDSFAKALKR